MVREALELRLVVTYDARKDRFMAQSVELSVLSNHGGFCKRMGCGALSVSAILNARSLSSREQIKLEKCADKAALLNVKAVLELRGAHNAVELESFSHSKFSASALRCAYKPRADGGDAGLVLRRAAQVSAAGRGRLGAL